jgi:hypothetical protein
VQLLEQWARADPPGTPAATSSTCDPAAHTSSTRQQGALMVPGSAASTPAATSEALSTGGPAVSLAASAVAMALQRLGSASSAATAADEAAWQQQHPTEPCFDWAYQRQHLLDLILALRQAGELPAILFNFERGLCMAYARLLGDALAAAEGRWREQHAGELRTERAKLDFGDSSADGGHDDLSSSSRGRTRQRGKAAGGAADGGGVGGSSSSGVDLRTVTVGGVVASADEELPDPSFTLLSYDKARSQVGVYSDDLYVILHAVSVLSGCAGMSAQETPRPWTSQLTACAAPSTQMKQVSAVPGNIKLLGFGIATATKLCNSWQPKHDLWTWPTHPWTLFSAVVAAGPVGHHC